MAAVGIHHGLQLGGDTAHDSVGRGRRAKRQRMLDAGRGASRWILQSRVRADFGNHGPASTQHEDAASIARRRLLTSIAAAVRVRIQADSGVLVIPVADDATVDAYAVAVRR